MAASELVKISEPSTGGNMMELEHVPKARLLMRHPIRRAQATRLSTDVHALQHQIPNVTDGFSRASSVPTYNSCLGLDPTCIPSYPSPSQHSNFPMPCSQDVHQGLMPEACFPQPVQTPLEIRSTFDVTQLGSLRYQQLELNTDPMGFPPLNSLDPYGLQPQVGGSTYGAMPEPLGPRGLCEDPAYQHSLLRSQPSSFFLAEALMPGGTGRSVSHNPYGVMIPTPRFVSGRQTKRCGGPIELPATNLGLDGVHNSLGGSQEKVSQRNGLDGTLDDQSVLDFMDEFLFPEKYQQSKSQKSTPKKGDPSLRITSA